MIEIRDLYKKFNDIEVLKGINLHINKGEIVSIVGKSGAGKTTLLQLIGTLDRPTSGQIIINRHDVSQMNEKQITAFRNEHIGFIFQFHQLLPEFTAIENVMIPGLIYNKYKKDDIYNRAKKLLTQLGLGERLNHKPKQLSGGEKQRVATARAMIMSPSIILADEPSGNLDETNKQDLHKLLQQLKTEFGQTILIVTHDYELAKISDRIVELKDGIIQK